MSKSKETKYINVLMSNKGKTSSVFPIRYVDCDIIAGFGMIEEIRSNDNSLEELRNFHCNHNDWLFGYISYDLKNEIEKLNSDKHSDINAENIALKNVGR